MRTIIDLHKEHEEWISEIKFMLHEMSFFKKLVANYEKQVNDVPFIQTLEAFKGEFDHLGEKFEKYVVEIQFHEVKLREQLQRGADPENTPVKDPVHLRQHYDESVRAFRIFKETFYEQISERLHELNLV